MARVSSSLTIRTKRDSFLRGCLFLLFPERSSFIPECSRSSLFGETRNANVYHFGTLNKKDYICSTKLFVMVVVSSREFRANQRKYFDLARFNDVVITSRSYGSYRLVPITKDDTLIDRETLDAKIRKGIADYEAGKVHRMNEGESSEDFLGRLINEV